MNHLKIQGHFLALVTILIWGTTFISTKILLVVLKPIEILIIRFIIGWVALFLIHPHRLTKATKKQEMTFALAGLCGICLYYLLENIALSYTSASHVGVIISVAPFFTAILSHFFFQKEKLSLSFYFGFFVAMMGIAFMSLQGNELSLNPLGDFLSFIAALIWACYSLLTKKISEYGYPIITTTRKIFSYGILFMILPAFMSHIDIDVVTLLSSSYIGNMLFLGLGASALCFVTWNQAVCLLGAVQTSVYIYLVPVITAFTSIVILEEQLTIKTALGIFMTLIGLLVSEYKGGERKQ